MLVDENIFEALALTKTHTNPIAVPSVEAMIALKLHAANQQNRSDAEKDWSDIIALFKIHRLRLDAPGILAMILRHGGQIRNRQNRSCARWRKLIFRLDLDPFPTRCVFLILAM